MPSKPFDVTYGRCPTSRLLSRVTSALAASVTSRRFERAAAAVVVVDCGGGRLRLVGTEGEVGGKRRAEHDAEGDAERDDDEDDEEDAVDDT